MTDDGMFAGKGPEDFEILSIFLTEG